MSIEKTGNSWRVVGEGADRAVLADATNVDGKLVYEIPSLREDRSQAGDAGGSYQGWRRRFNSVPGHHTPHDAQDAAWRSCLQLVDRKDLSLDVR